MLGIRCVLLAVSAAFGREPVRIAALKLVEVPHCHVAEADAEGRGEPSDVPEHVTELPHQRLAIEGMAVEDMLLHRFHDLADLSREAESAIEHRIPASRLMRIGPACLLLVRVEVHPAFLLRLSPTQRTTRPICRMRSAIRSP